MTNTYLVAVIKVFQPYELEELASYLAGYQANRGSNTRELLRLYQVILEAAPDFAEESLSKERIYKHVFGDQSVVSGKLEKLMADLNKVVRRYALSKQYFAESNEKRQQIDWAIWQRVRGLKDRAQQTLSKLKAQNEIEKVKSLEQYLIDLLIAEEEHMWNSTYNQVKGDLNIPKLIHQLDLYYYNYRVDRINRYLLQKKGAQLPEANFEDLGLNFYLQDSVLLQISHQIFEIFTKETPSVEDTQKLIHFLKSNEQYLSYDALDHFYAFIRSSCVILINAGNLNFVFILHQIQKENLDRGFLFINGKIPSHTYLNLVQVASRAKEYTWAKEFTEEYQNRIVGGDEDQFYFQFNMAQCLFGEGQFEEALDYLPEASSTTHYHHIIRRLELKIYYEIKSDLLHYKLDAFRKYIERTAPKALAANLRTMDLNFLNILLQLIQSPMKDKVRSARLIKRIEEKKLLADRAWLLEKAKELG